MSPKGGQIGGDDFDLSEDIDMMCPLVNPEHYMAIIIECLAVLGKIPEAVEVMSTFIIYLFDDSVFYRILHKLVCKFMMYPQTFPYLFTVFESSDAD